MPYSQLHTLQKNDNNNINTNKRYYCYRHKLDLKRNSMNSNESTMLENLQQFQVQVTDIHELFGEKKNVAASTAKAFTKLIPKRKPSK
ncbi:3518_t:CDS:2 [Entrophospora sp. SA101]|nr:3518_t:CDS:2 [Entrophospora sp. SA101]